MANDNFNPFTESLKNIKLLRKRTDHLRQKLEELNRLKAKTILRHRSIVHLFTTNFRR